MFGTSGRQYNQRSSYHGTSTRNGETEHNRQVSIELGFGVNPNEGKTEHSCSQPVANADQSTRIQTVERGVSNLGLCEKKTEVCETRSVSYGT